jgi:hypothetical protein
LLSVSSTFAPCSAKTRAVSAPIPDAPPVTIATLPTSLLPGCMVVSLVRPKSCPSGGGSAFLENGSGIERDRA